MTRTRVLQLFEGTFAGHKTFDAGAGLVDAELRKKREPGYYFTKWNSYGAARKMELTFWYPHFVPSVTKPDFRSEVENVLAL